MIVDRHDPINLFEMVPELELQFEPELAQLDVLLEEDELFLLLRQIFLNATPTQKGSGVIHAGRGDPEDAGGQKALRMEPRTDRAFRLRFDRLEAALPALPRTRSRRHHAHPLGECDRCANPCGSQRPCRGVGPIVEAHPWQKAQNRRHGGRDQHPPSHRRCPHRRWGEGHKPARGSSEGIHPGGRVPSSQGRAFQESHS